ncbi:hypothetical protein HDU98_004166, partial [Podochytrium sp. JEL0797]
MRLVSMIVLLRSQSTTLVKSLLASVENATEIRAVLDSAAPFLVVRRDNIVEVKVLQITRNVIDHACVLMSESVNLMKVACLSVEKGKIFDEILVSMGQQALDPLSLRGSKLNEFAEEVAKKLGVDAEQKSHLSTYRFFEEEMYGAPLTNVETLRNQSAEKGVELLRKEDHISLQQFSLKMVVVADSGYSFRVKMTNMHELDGEVAKMLLHLKPLNKSEHAAFENKLPVCVCDYKDCGKTFMTM